MGVGAWSPPIPEGRDAVRAWKDLDRPLRRELMRSTRPHPDPTVAAVAVGYARAMQARGWMARSVLQGVLITLPLIIGLIVAGMPSDTVTLLAVAVALVRVALSARTWTAWLRMESANSPHLSAARAASSWSAPQAAASPLTVRADGWWVLRWYGGTVALTAVGWGVVRLLAGPAVYIPVLVLFGVLAILVAGWGLFMVGRGPLLTLDAEGVESFGLRMAWREVSEVRIVPQRMMFGKQSARRVVVFVATDPQPVLARAKGTRAWAARRCLDYYGGPLATDDYGTNRSAEEIATSAQALAGLPIHRFAETP